MTIQYKTDPNRRLILVRLADALTARDVMGYFQVVHPDPRVSRYDRLIVVDELTAVMPGRELAAIAQYAQHSAGADCDHRAAVVAPSDIAFGVARQYQMYRQLPGNRLFVFRNVEAATAWLGLLDPPTLTDLDPIEALTDDFYVPMHRMKQHSAQATEQQTQGVRQAAVVS